MKIVRIIGRLNVGGPARHVVWLTQGLRDTCESLLVAGTVPDGEDDMSYFARENNVQPIYIPEMSREISWRDVIAVWKLYRLLLRERPDIIHTHTAKAGTIGRIAALWYRWLTLPLFVGRPRRCRVVHTYHGHIFHSYYGPTKTKLFLFIERTLARLGTDRIVVVSKQQRKEINETFGVGEKKQFAVIPLGIELKQFANWTNRRRRFRETVEANDNQIIIGIVGRLTGVKNHSMFLEAIKVFRETQTAGKDVRFVIIGDGNLRQALERRATELGLQTQVTFAGNRNDPENFYPALDIVALTSLNEGTPLTLIEAMANARPIIATAVGGVVDLLGEPRQRERASQYTVCERGISVPASDAASFAAGLDHLISNVELQRDMGQRAVKFVTENHSKERLVTDVKNLYRELMQLGSANVPVHSAENRMESRI